MAVNRYDQPAQAEFINTYVPIPFDQMMKVGMLKQSLIEQGDKLADDTMSSLANFSVGPYDEENYQEIRRNYESKLGNLYNNSGGPGTYDFKRGVNMLRTEMAMDPVLRGMKYNLAQYQEANKRKQEARDKGAEGSDSYDLDYSLNYLDKVGGTVGLMEKTGNPKWTPGNWSKPVNIYSSIEQMVNDVDASSIEKEVANGKWDVTTKEGGRYADALTAPLGIAFKQVPAKGGKGVAYSTEIVDPAEFRYNLMNTDWGRKALRNAAYSLHKAPNTIDKEVEQLATEEVKGYMVKAVKERITRNTSQTMDIDPEWMARFKDDLENRQNNLTWPTATHLQGSSIENLDDMNLEISAAESNVESVENSYNDLKTQVKALPVYDNKGAVIGYEYKNDVGRDLTDEMRKREAALDIAKRKHADLNNTLIQVKNEAAQELKVRPDYEPSIEVKKKAFRKALKYGPVLVSTTEEQDRLEKEFDRSLWGGGSTLNLTGIEDSKKSRLEEEYQKQLGDIDIFTKKVNEKLSERHKDKVITIGLANFSNKKDNLVMEDAFLAHMTASKEGQISGIKIGLRDEYTGEPLSTKEYKKLANDQKPIYKGWSQNPNTGEVQVHYKAYTKGSEKGGVTTKDVTAPAPGGFLNMLLNNNMVTEAEIYVGDALSDDNFGPDGRAEVILMDSKGKEHKVQVARLSRDEQKLYSGAPEYRIEYDEVSRATNLVDTTVKTISGLNNVVYDIINYGRKMNQGSIETQ